MKHVEVYRETGRYAGWPANYGIWSWGNEVVVCFTVGYMKEEISGFHPRDASRPFYTVQARSQDGGESWKVIPMTCKVPGNKSLSAVLAIPQTSKIRLSTAPASTLPIQT